MYVHLKSTYNFYGVRKLYVHFPHSQNLLFPYVYRFTTLNRHALAR